MNLSQDIVLQYITHVSGERDEIAGAEGALNGGCRWIQLRMKEAPDEQFCIIGEKLGALCREYGATFILDDRAHLVKRLKADGVHLGKNDMPLEEARELLGPDMIIGATANTVEEALNAVYRKADYVGVGPFRYTTTKKNLSAILGVDGLRNLMKQVREVSDIPVVGIGGIKTADIAEIMLTEVSGIALSGEILNADDPVETTKRIIEILHNV
ncbi:MAG: thiamine phosphate synthase [Bacteroidales bacterium]|nr:thiamine phosphate synthase [Bacteroidales bacterium]